MGRHSAEDRKAQIVGEVLRLADEIGPDRLSTTDVARAVGVTQPAIFRHFPNKAALWLAVAEDVAARLTEAWDTAEARAPSPADRVRALIAAQLQTIAHTPALPSILFSRELQVENPALREVFRTLLARFQVRLVAAIEDRRAAERLRLDVAAADIAVLLISLVQGVAIRWTLGARGFELVDEGLRLFDVQMALLRTEEAASDD